MGDVATKFLTAVDQLQSEVAKNVFDWMGLGVFRQAGVEARFVLPAKFAELLESVDGHDAFTALVLHREPPEPGFDQQLLRRIAIDACAYVFGVEPALERGSRKA
jgi:hypothetical protein